MTNTKRNLVEEVMNEYVNFGGPIVTRAVAYADCIARGFTAHEADYIAIGRKAVEDPEDPEAHLAMFREIQSMWA